jgi:hypothetical protein
MSLFPPGQFAAQLGELCVEGLDDMEVSKTIFALGRWVETAPRYARLIHRHRDMKEDKVGMN